MCVYTRVRTSTTMFTLVHAEERSKHVHCSVRSKVTWISCGRAGVVHAHTKGSWSVINDSSLRTQKRSSLAGGGGEWRARRIKGEKEEAFLESPSPFLLLDWRSGHGIHKNGRRRRLDGLGSGPDLWYREPCVCGKVQRREGNTSIEETTSFAFSIGIVYVHT